ncbi:MAG TPA: fatty acid desaturase [Pirellulaceae bacterium]
MGRRLAGSAVGDIMLTTSSTLEALATKTSMRPVSDRLAAQCRPLVEDFFTPRPSRMWIDFFVTLVVAYAAAWWFLLPAQDLWVTCLAYGIAVGGLYRLSMFIHEIVHFRRHQMPGFAKTWNLLAGVPLLMPSFLYDSHLTHHNPRHYGTRADGEYLPLGLGSVRGLLLFLGQILIHPLYVFSRFCFGTPVSLLHRSWRHWILERASSLVINFSYCREIPEQGIGRFEFWLEIACMLRAWALVATVVLGFAPWSRLPMFYLLACGALGLNHLRTLAAHRYRNAGGSMSHDDQFLDSTNITGTLVTEVLCPLGLRYHALHHLLPAVPYYHLPAAHRRLTQLLPETSPYHDATYPSYSSVVRELIRSVISSGRQTS